jgi:hypothetical protein
MKHQHLSLRRAAKITIRELGQLGGSGGIIAIDSLGNSKHEVLIRVIYKLNSRSGFVLQFGWHV